MKYKWLRTAFFIGLFIAFFSAMATGAEKDPEGCTVIGVGRLATVGGVYWFYVDNPYVSTYVPIYAGVEEVSELYKTYDYERYSPKNISQT